MKGRENEIVHKCKHRGRPPSLFSFLLFTNNNSVQLLTTFFRFFLCWIILYWYVMKSWKKNQHIAATFAFEMDPLTSDIKSFWQRFVLYVIFCGWKITLSVFSGSQMFLNCIKHFCKVRRLNPLCDICTDADIIFISIYLYLNEHRKFPEKQETIGWNASIELLKINVHLSVTS